MFIINDFPLLFNFLLKIGVVIALDTLSNRHLTCLTFGGILSKVNYFLSHKGGTRELFIISASLTSCDPGSIEKMKTDQIRCSVISLTAETFVYKKLVKETDGVMNVSLDSGHFNELLMELVKPPPLSVKYPMKWGG
jgi:hypothetical protein